MQKFHFYLMTQWNTDLREELVISQLGEKLNPKVHNRLQKGPLFVPVSSQISPIHAIHFCFIKQEFNIILYQRLCLSGGLFRFPHQYTFPLPSRATCSAHIILYLIVCINIW